MDFLDERCVYKLNVETTRFLGKWGVRIERKKKKKKRELIGRFCLGKWVFDFEVLDVFVFEKWKSERRSRKLKRVEKAFRNGSYGGGVIIIIMRKERKMNIYLIK